MNNHQIVIYEAKGVLKTALKVGMGIKLGLELGDFIYYGIYISFMEKGIL